MSKDEILSYASLSPAKKKHTVTRQSPVTPIELPEGTQKKRKRVGRGRATGVGKTCGRGQKGHKARSGYSARAGFEGGQMPLHRRLPKRGFNNIFKKEYQTLNLWMIQKAGVQGEVTPEMLENAGLIPDAGKLVKILATGEITIGINITADAFSESAKVKIEKAGGSCRVRTRKVSNDAKVEKKVKA